MECRCATDSSCWPSPRQACKPTGWRKAFDNPTYKTNIIERVGLAPNAGTPEAFDQYIRAQLRDVGELVKYLGVKPE
ncbi:MAG: hypothetical protein A3H35_20810 [Betaproteobacteria bacterium RIFCSPLOWO2_02_FULL_62_17]|nr:MAG: hypothetical protein A3H35_20810 [Betaproteobacteria bacterium RIFCSPLOWO2_02_FULL_62_17]